jgi:hypothetical protein
MNRITLIAGLILGSLGNEFDMDNPEPFCASGETDTDDDIIREELTRRSEFDKQHKKALMRLLIRPGVRDDREVERLAARATREAMYRSAFDKRHPRIYKSAEERRQAYAIFRPVTQVRERLNKSSSRGDVET